MADMTEPPGLTIEQIRLARELGPHMLDILCGWICAETTLTAKGVSFRKKLRASAELRGLFASAEAVTARVLNGSEEKTAKCLT